jgi:hypothetical protein
MVALSPLPMNKYSPLDTAVASHRLRLHGKRMKISVVMIDGQFRENTFGAEYFSHQDVPDDSYEVIWVEFYSNVPVRAQKKVRVITLNNPDDKIYHSSYCFNRGIVESTGELIVIPDADQLVRPDFLRRLSAIHLAYDKLVVYAYRYDEVEKGALKSLDFDELEKKCILKNPLNYGGCLSVRKKWLFEINGYEQHRIFGSGFHANGMDMCTRFKNLGLAIMWAPELKLYHPWHENTRVPADQYCIQKDIIQWRARNRGYLAIDGIEESKNLKTFNETAFMNWFEEKQKEST